MRGAGRVVAGINHNRQTLPMLQGPPGFTAFFWLLLIAFLVAILARRFRAPYSLTLVITGLVIGAPRLLPHVHLDPQTLFTVFLPPLLFESAFNLPAGPLGRDWKPITLYAPGGPVASPFLIRRFGGWGLGRFAPPGPHLRALLFPPRPPSRLPSPHT